MSQREEATQLAEGKTGPSEKVLCPPHAPDLEPSLAPHSLQEKSELPSMATSLSTAPMRSELTSQLQETTNSPALQTPPFSLPLHLLFFLPEIPRPHSLPDLRLKNSQHVTPPGATGACSVVQASVEAFNTSCYRQVVS